VTDPAAAAGPASPARASWQVWRQDDNGARVLVAVDADEAAARARAERLERGGHKQLYWVTEVRVTR
jgi:hypothetical protein